jgi:hypothetical protein
MQNPYSPPEAIISPVDENGGVTSARWYHWALFILCIPLLATIGILDVSSGAAIGSRFYDIDEFFVRAAGVGFIVAAISLIFRKRWAFDFSIFHLGSSALEIVVTSSTDGLWSWFVVVLCSLIAGFTALIMWLRNAIARTSH